MQIASLRFHWVAESRDVPLSGYARMPEESVGKHLWGYTLLDAAARASLAAVDAGRFTGHEVFYITAPDTASDTPTSRARKRASSGHPAARRPQWTPEPVRCEQGRAAIGMGARLARRTVASITIGSPAGAVVC